MEKENYTDYKVKSKAFQRQFVSNERVTCLTTRQYKKHVTISYLK